MGIHFFVFILFGICSNVIGSVQRSKNGYKDEYYNRNFVYNPDEYAKVTRPCKVSDLNCISKYFAKHAKCTIPSTPLPNLLTRKQIDVFLPAINTSITHTTDTIGEFRNSRVEEFYLNKATNKAVFAVELRNLTVTVRNAYFNFYREGQEPIVVATNASLNYTSITVTAVIPNIDDLNLEKSEITAYVADSNPEIYIGPEVSQSTNTTVQERYAALIANVPVELLEVMLTESPFYLLSYLQSIICDFGLKVI